MRARRVAQERPLQTSIRLPSLCSLQQPPPPPRTLAPVSLLREDPASLNFLHFLFHHYGNHRLALFRHFSLKEETRGRGEGGGSQRRSGTPEVPEANPSVGCSSHPSRREVRWVGLGAASFSVASSKRGWGSDALLQKPLQLLLRSKRRTIRGGLASAPSGTLLSCAGL